MLPNQTLAPKRAGMARAYRRAMRTEAPEDHQRLEELRQDYAAAKLEAAIRQTVDEWPPLTDEQLDKLAVLLRNGQSRG